MMEEEKSKVQKHFNKKNSKNNLPKKVAADFSELEKEEEEEQEKHEDEQDGSEPAV